MVWNNFLHSPGKVLLPIGCTILTMAAPSRMTASVAGTSLDEGWTFSRHLSRSDLLPGLSVPFCDSEGENLWFSCEKNSSRLPFLVWQPIKSLENKEQFLFRVAICSFARSVFFTLETSNSSSLFLLILAKIDICFGLSVVAGLELIEFLQLVLLLRHVIVLCLAATSTVSADWEDDGVVVSICPCKIPHTVSFRSFLY